MEVDVNTTLSGMPAIVLPSDEKLIEDFVDIVERDEKTLVKYKQHLLEFHAFLSAQAGGKPLPQAQKADVTLFVAHLKKGTRYGLTGDGKPRSAALSESTRKSVVSALRAFYKHCAEHYGLERDPSFLDPTKGITVPRPEVKRGLTIREADVKRILNAPGRERDRVQAYLAYYTAARTMSLRFLLWSDVDFELGEIHFNAKFKNHYTVPMHPQLDAALRRWRDEVLKQAEKNHDIKVALCDPDTAYVLLTRTGRPLCHTTIAKQAKWRAGRVGVLRHADPNKVGKENASKVHPHAFRRTAGTLLRRSGTDLADIADLLNHKDLNTTRTHYAFTSTPRLKKTVMGLTL
jgi:integrase/recombinase XerD